MVRQKVLPLGAKPTKIFVRIESTVLANLSNGKPMIQKELVAEANS